MVLELELELELELIRIRISLIVIIKKRKKTEGGPIWVSNNQIYGENRNKNVYK
jgi:hypothetical protein